MISNIKHGVNFWRHGREATIFYKHLLPHKLEKTFLQYTHGLVKMQTFLCHSEVCCDVPKRKQILILKVQ